MSLEGMDPVQLADLISQRPTYWKEVVDFDFTGKNKLELIESCILFLQRREVRVISSYSTKPIKAHQTKELDSTDEKIRQTVISFGSEKD